MHHCLQVSEILAIIARFICENSAFGTAASLAGTCKTIEKPTLDVLWEYQSSLTTLFNCLPPENIIGIKAKSGFRALYGIAVGKEVTFLPPPSAANLRRIQVRAGRMRSIKINFNPSQQERLSLEVWNWLSLHELPVFHNLRHFEVLPMHEEKPYLDVIPRLSPLLTSIAVFIDDDWSLVQSTLPDFSRFQQLENLSVRTRDQTTAREVDDVASRMPFWDLTGLRKLSLSTMLPDGSVEKIARLPGLEELTTGVAVEAPLALSPPAFPSLKCLEIETDFVIGWNNLLHSCQDPNVEKVGVTFLLPIDLEELQRSLNTMEIRGFHKTLKTASFVYDNIGPSGEAFAVPSGEIHRLTPNLLPNLTAFKHLTHLKIASTCDRITCRFGLTDASLESFAKCLPSITNLDLGGHPCSAGNASHVTFRGIARFAGICHALQYLRTHVCPAVENTLITPPNRNSRSNDLRTLEVGSISINSWRDRVGELALVLIGLFPKLEKVVGSSPEWEEVSLSVKFFRG